MSTLDEWVKYHEELCSCSTMHIEDLKYCDCGQKERVSELTQLRGCVKDLEEQAEVYKGAREVIESLRADLVDAKRSLEIGQSMAEHAIDELRAALDEARRIIKSLPYIYPPAAAWLEKYPIVPD